jgi:hypothetical protein
MYVHDVCVVLQLLASAKSFHVSVLFLLLPLLPQV